MVKAEVEIGGWYAAKVSNKIVTVEIIRESTVGGWVARNLETGRDIYIKTAKRLRKKVQKRLEPHG